MESQNATISDGFEIRQDSIQEKVTLIKKDIHETALLGLFFIALSIR